MGEKDKEVRGAFKNKHLFMEFIRKYVPQLKSYEIKEDNLEWIDPNSITPDLSEKSGDVFYKLEIAEKKIYIYVALEHKSTVEYDTVIQTMMYTYRIWEKEYKSSGEKGNTKEYKLPAVIMVLFYEGEENWTASLDFREKITSIDCYDPFVLEMVDLKKIPEEELKKSREAIDYFILLRKPNVYDLKVEDIVNMAKSSLNEEEWSTFVEFLYSKVKKVYSEEEIEELRVKKGGEKIMGILERAFIEAEEKGIREGKEEGIKEGIEMGLDIKFGEIGMRIMDNIKKIHDITKLKAIKEAIRKAKTIDDVVKVI